LSGVTRRGRSPNARGGQRACMDDDLERIELEYLREVVGVRVKP
jgi:hypothetical protein